jgi:hypothetical protein
VGRLQRGRDPESQLAQKVFEQGHYAGRTQPTDTRQGTYATAPNGVMLASINSNNPRAMAEMLRRALDKWNAMPAEQRLLDFDPSEKKGEIVRPESHYPEDGLTMRVISRDLPREKTASDWRGQAWNQDYAWFKREEVLSMLPERIEAGQSRQVPDALIRRLARFNFVDNVRGQTLAYNQPDISQAALRLEVVEVKNGIATVRLNGETTSEKVGNWPIANYRDMHAPAERKISMDLKIFGTGKYDIETGRFTQLEMVALGTRSGGTQYNGRYDDLDPTPVGYLLTLTDGSPAQRVAPSFFHAYGW